MMDVPFRGRSPGAALEGRLVDGAAAAAASLLVVASRIPLRSRYLLNWDADQFALGVRHLDVVHHEPHPPGYLGYVLLGRALLPLTHDVNAALVFLSVAGEVAGVAGAFLFARALFGRAAAWATALALAASPLYWYYGEAANTYALEPALVLLIAWFCWRLWQGSRDAAMPAALVLGLAGAIRPSTEVLMAPLLVVALVRQRSLRLALRSGGVVLGAVSAWLVPLVVLSGGPLDYWQALTQLGGSVTESTALWRAGIPGLATNARAILLGLVWELGASAVLLLFGLVAAPRLGTASRLPRGWAAFLAAWTIPALLTFLLIHIGEVVYVQLFTPALFLMIGPALAATAAALGRVHLQRSLLAAALAGQLAIFFLPSNSSLSGQLRQHDAQVEDLVATVHQFDPDHTVLLADAVAVGSYRTSQIYLPEYHRLGLGRDRHGAAGEIYGDAYEPWRFDRATTPDYPENTTTFIFLDRSLVRSVVADPGALSKLPTARGSGLRLYVWRGAPPVCCQDWLWLDPDLNNRGM
jgi:hypothetical protein